MKQETPTLAATKRDRVGTRYSQRLRKNGQLPGVIYGHKTEPVSISVNEKETAAALKHGAHVVNIALDGKPTETCLIKELQFGYLGDNVIHVDFARVDLNEEVEVKVHLRFTGSPESAKKPGSVLGYPMTELEVVCKVKDIPEEIRVDIGKMEEQFTVGEIQLPPGIRTNVPAHMIVAQVTFVKEEVVAPVAAEAAEVAPTAAEPEVITEKKAEEKAAAKADDKTEK